MVRCNFHILLFRGILQQFNELTKKHDIQATKPNKNSLIVPVLREFLVVFYSYESYAMN